MRVDLIRVVQLLGDTKQSVEVPVVVQLDGREIARGVGTANVETSERSGVTAAPGQSRRTRESGVDYSSGSIGMGALR